MVCFQHDTHTLSKRCERRGAGLRRFDRLSRRAPSLTFMTEDAPQRDHALREVLNGLRWIVRTGAPWRMMPNAPPPCTVGRRLSAHPALAEGRGLCDARP